MTFSFVLIFLDAVTTPPAHLPDLFVVLNVVWSCGIFGLGWLWSLTRLIEEAWGMVGLGSGDSPSVPLSSGSYRRATLSPSVSEYSLRSRSPNMEAVEELDGDDHLRPVSKPRSSSIASSSRTATRRSRRSPMVSPVEEPPQELFLSASYRPSRQDHQIEKQHRRTSSMASKGDREQNSRYLQPSRLGNLSTQVSPSKTYVPSTEDRYQPALADVFGERADLAKWKQATLSDFQ